MKPESDSLAGPQIQYHREGISVSDLIRLYDLMLFPRMLEEKMLNLLRQGRITKWFSGIGQEAISVGVTAAVDPDTYLFPLHRNLGVFTSRQLDLTKLIGQWLGKREGFSKGRDRSFHFGSLDHHLVGMISHLGPQLALADGVALAHKLSGQKRVVVAFTGEGATSEGDFHEALNIASVWQLPVIFVIENNAYALSTPTHEQYRVKDLASRAIGYGMTAHVIDGNNVLDVFRCVKSCVEDIKKTPQPILIECKTFRMRGHEEASGIKYVPPGLIDDWQRKDPLTNYEAFLGQIQLLDEGQVAAKRAANKEKIDLAVNQAFALNDPDIDPKTELAEVLGPTPEIFHPLPSSERREIRFIDAISEGLDQSLEQQPHLICMGQDIAEYGGVFKVTNGLVEKYGRNRMRNTPLCESGIIGTAIGLTFEGYAAMVEMQFADFVSCGFNQIVNNLAKMYYRWGHNPNVTIRMPTGGNVGAGPFHSQSTEGWFFQTPGLKIVYPSTAYDAKGLLMTSLADPGPVLYFEHKYLYRSATGSVPQAPYQLPLGKANLISKGDQATCVTYGLGTYWAKAAAASLGAQIDILDLRTLMPLDLEAIDQSVKKTGRLIVLHEASLTGNIGGEISAYVGEHLFEYLDAPIMRCGSLDTPVPFHRNLEAGYLPEKRFVERLRHLLAY